MLRALVALLLVVNLAFYGWSLGWLDGIVGIRAQGDREPERLAKQVRPESVVILPPSGELTAAQPDALGAAQPVCLEAGPFGAAQLAEAAAALRGAEPGAAWHDVKLDKPGAASPLHMLRIEQADAALAARLMQLKLAALGAGFTPCADSPAARQATG